MTDPISDFLTRLRNASQARQAETASPHSQMKEAIAAILKEDGFISDYSQGTDERGHKTLVVKLKMRNEAPAITQVNRVSTPGRRLYFGYQSPAGPQRPRHQYSLHVPRPDEQPELPSPQGRWRVGLHGLVTQGACP
jgi:small subunit ribosomal protein S8